MFGATVFDFWGTHDNWPMLGGPECQLAFVVEYARRQREQYCSIFIHDDHSEQDDNEMPIRFAKMIKRRKEIDASAKKSMPRPKRQKKNCLFDIALRRVEDGAESVQVICSGDEFDNMEHKMVALLEARDLGDAEDGIQLRDAPGAHHGGQVRRHQCAPQPPQRTGAARLQPLPLSYRRAGAIQIAE